MVEIKTNLEDPYDYTRFEKARIIGARSLQIAMGAPVLLEDRPEDTHDPVRIAEFEYQEGFIPVTVHRGHEDPWARDE
jgi:DNA-directed RNA polymerase subunit K